MISRKREVEKAVSAAFQTFATADLTGVQVITSRATQELDSATVQIVCNRQVADGDLSGDQNVFVEVEGAIICSTVIKNTAPTTIETLEKNVENFLEKFPTDLITLINAESVTVQLTDIQPGDYEDGVDTDRDRYIARYNFSANVVDLTDI